MAFNNTNMLRIAQIGAMTRPEFRNMPTLDIGGAVNNFMNERDKSLEAARRQAYVDELAAAHPEDAAQIAANPDAYVKMINDNAAAERDQQYKMDMLDKQFNNSIALQDRQHANAVGLARLRMDLENQAGERAKAQRMAQLDEALNNGMISQEQYNMAKQRELLGDIVKGVAFDPKTAMDLRKEHRQNNKDYYTVGDAYSRMKNVAENPSAAGDISMIFSYMKMLDPNSTVREGEYATAQNAAGIPTRVMNLYNQTLQGTRLSDLQRNDFLNQAGNLFAAQKARFDRESDYYRDIATKSGLNPDDVIYDPYDFEAVQQNQEQYPEGTVIEDGNGNRMVMRGGQWQQM